MGAARAFPDGIDPRFIRCQRQWEALQAASPYISAMHPMNRLGRPEEVANAICWLLSDEASFVTGHILNVDGGFQAK